MESLVVSLRTDIEFIFADNSDDPSIMNSFMTDVIRDPRVTYLPSTDRVLPMNANWERCVDAACGDFLCVIGDDDYVDPDVADLLRTLCENERDVDVLVWSRLNYNWPDNRKIPCSVGVPLGTRLEEVKREHLFQEFFSWQTHDSTPHCPFSIYHGAVSRRVIDSNKARFGGRHFSHLTVDFETSCKLLVNAKRFFYCERPFSVLGACFASNSGTIGNPNELKRRHAEIMAELGRNMDEDPYMKDFPFGCILGVTAAVAQVQQWFCVTYGFTRPAGWERNFAEACGIDCGNAKSEHAFELMVAGYKQALGQWKGGRFLKHFNPKYTERSNAKVFRGIDKTTLYLDEDVPGVETPADLYRFVGQVIISPAEIATSLVRRKVA
ncbi:glycosyltransferase [Rhizobium sp. YIM 134829]|uniref:glycosyltransferase n=1 Tax=Rhizobium sp. YIM 134829 TaxID=3390453 RepID=UPI00397970CD